MIRRLEENEIEALLDLICEMADYEKLRNEVVATKESLYKSIFIDKVCKAALIEVDKEVAGYILYFYNFSSFTGCPNLYIEDIFVKEQYRHNGLGGRFI